MKSCDKLNTLGVFSFYFIVLLTVGLFVRDIPNQPEIYKLTLQQFMSESVLNDPKSFCLAAIDIAKNGWVSPENAWILNLWPPGFIALQAIILKVMGLNAPALFVVQILVIALFSVVITNLYLFSKKLFSNDHSFLKWLCSLIFPLLLFVFPVARIFILEPIGVTLGEGPAIGFFLLFIFAICYAFLEKNWLRYSIFAGLFLALSAYFRSHFEIILLGLTGWFILLLLFSKSKFFVKKFPTLNRKHSLRVVGVALLVAHIATVPWRIYHYIDKGYPAWVSTVLVTFDNSVMPTEYFLENSGGFVVEGGGNLVCRIEPTSCGDREHAKTLFIKVFLTNPLKWYSLKLEVISKYWFSSPENWTSVVEPASFSDYLYNLLVIALLFLCVRCVLSKKYRQHKLWPLFLWLNLSLFSSYFLIFTVQQFEVRYFYFPKIMIIVMWLIMLSIFHEPKIEKP